MLEKTIADELRAAIRPTTLITSARLNDVANADVILASETFQHTGSFKFRAAYNAALKSSAAHMIAASSGNFGQALAYACHLLKKKCTIVMPDNSAQVKIDAVRHFGGIVETVNVKTKTRAQRVAELHEEDADADVVSAYDHENVIEGNSTLGEELALVEGLDGVIVPIGGGGLSSGIISGLRRKGCHVPVYAAEPMMANDASRSLATGELQAMESEPQTLADGARTLCLGRLNWNVLKHSLSGVIEVSEEDIVGAVRKLFFLANLKAEPTGALSLAALLGEPRRFSGKKVCCIVSGGNVDVDNYCRLIK